MREKIYYIINGRIPTEKANGYQISQMCQAFKENGYEVELLRPLRKLLPAHAQFQNNLKEFYNLKHEFLVRDIFSIDFLHYFNKVFFIRRFQTIANILHSFSFVLGLAIFFRRKNGKENFIYLRDVNILAWLLPFLNSTLIKKIILELHSFPEKQERRKRYVKVLKNAKAVVCVTNKMRQDLIDLGFPSEKALVQHDGVDLESFKIAFSQEECRKKLGYPQDDFIIGYVGNFQTNGKEKGIDDLIRSSVIIFKEFPRAKFYCVGGPLSVVPYYESIIKDLGLPRENFVFSDRVPVKEVPLVMSACDVLTIPFPWNPHFAFYASPMKLFEYMSSDRLIVATDIESLKEVLVDGENALLAKHGQIKDLAEVLMKGIRNKELRDTIAANALILVKNYTWKERAKNIFAFVKGI